MKPVIGIDFGTSTALAVRLKPDGTFQYLLSDFFPTVLYSEGDGHFKVAKEAQDKALETHKPLIRSVKRSIGQNVKITVSGRDYDPSELAVLIFEKIYDDVYKVLRQKQQSAVVTVPAHFNEIQRAAIFKAAQTAGFKVLRMINEPTAAALASGADFDHDAFVVIFDFGGGTLDVTVMEIMGKIYEVKASVGENHLGGVDFTNDFLEHLKGRVSEITFEDAERFKIELSKKDETRLRDGTKVTRGDFERCVSPLIERSASLVTRVLNEAKISPHDVAYVYMAGGTSQIPVLKKRLKAIFHCPVEVLNPAADAVGRGAAIYADIISRGRGKGHVLIDVVSKGFGVETEGGHYTEIITPATPVPVTVKRLFTTVRDYQKSIRIKILENAGSSEQQKKLADIVLEGVRPLESGVPRIEVIFDIDISGILHVRALDLDLNQEKKVYIQHELSNGQSVS